MSLITHVTAVASRIDAADREFLTNVGIDDERRQSLGEVGQDGKNAAGGTKSYVDDLFLAALNYVVPSELLDHYQAHSWHPWSRITIVVSYENWESDGVWQVRDGRFAVLVDGVAS